MRVGAVGSNPYVYNTNAVSSASMKKIQGIGNDLTASRSDFSNLTSAGENTNPLKVGETKNFVDIMDMQMQMGRMNASRVMNVSPFEEEAVRNVYSNEQAIENQQQNAQAAAIGIDMAV